jgi:HEAT repeat protein
MAIAQQSFQDTLSALAGEPLADFKIHFRRLRTAFPMEATEACLWYLAAQRADSAADQMASWLISDSRYLQLLFDPSKLPLEKAAVVVRELKEADIGFYRKFYQAANALSDAKSIIHALSLIPFLGNYEILLPLLRTYSHHANERIRSKAVKLLCQLRPKKTLIERQMESQDPRVRASAMEALWYAPDPDSVSSLAKGAKDTHHRVVANALVGLHLHEDPTANDKLMDMACHPQALFRSAAAWALGFVRNERAIPLLEILVTDSSATVRKRALQSLRSLHPNDEAESAADDETAKVGSPLL